MKRKALLVILLIISVSFPSRARFPDGSFLRRFNFGVEWGYSQSLLRIWDYNFVSEEGYRIYERDGGFHIRPNGSVFVQAGYLLNEEFVIALYGGFLGVGENNRLLPLQLRLSWFPYSVDEDGGFYYLQGGPAFHLHEQESVPGWLFAGGLGYRLPLNPGCSLDILFGAKYLHDHPLLPDPERPGYVPAHRIRKNNAGYCALDLSIAVNF